MRPPTSTYSLSGYIAGSLLLAAKSTIRAQPCDVSTRVRKAGDQPCSYRVGNIFHDDGNCFGSILGSLGCWSASDNDDVYLELHQLGGKVRKPVSHSLSITVLNDGVLALDI